MALGSLPPGPGHAAAAASSPPSPLSPPAGLGHVLLPDETPRLRASGAAGLELALPERLLGPPGGGGRGSQRVGLFGGLSPCPLCPSGEIEEEMENPEMVDLPEKLKHQLRHRELFLSRQLESLPATHIRYRGPGQGAQVRYRRPGRGPHGAGTTRGGDHRSGTAGLDGHGGHPLPLMDALLCPALQGEVQRHFAE